VPNLPWPYNTVFSLTTVATALGSAVVNVWNFEASEALESSLVNDEVAQGESGDLVDEWLATMKAPWLATHPNDYVINLVTCQVVERPGNFRHRLTPSERPLGSANSGTVSGIVEEAFAAAVVRWRTPQAGKSHRGRTYIGPIVQPWMTDGRLAAAGITAVTAFGTAMNNAYGGGGLPTRPYRLTVYSRPYNNGEYQYATRKTGSLTVVTPPDYAGNSTNVTTFSVDPILRVQRRRELGVGA
jgi:hypothetical protein